MRGDPIPLGDILRGYLARLVAPTAERARLDTDRLSIPRQPLPLLLRRAVLSRDGYRCCWCLESLARNKAIVFEIDHIIPWSAGGSDHPVNLRTLCQGCNQVRSNRVSEFDRRALPVVWRCSGCDEWGDVDLFASTISAYCMTCKETVRAPHVEELMIGGAVPAVGVPALEDGDEDYSAIPLARRISDRRWKNDDEARRAARAELDAIRPKPEETS